jgi:hypothetical protein
MKYLKFSLFVVLAFSLTQTFAQRQHLVWESTFETQNSIDNWYEHSIYKSWSANLYPWKYRAGKSSIMFDLIRDADLTNGPRAELGMDTKNTSKESWYGFSNFFPADYVSDPATEVINQWQAYPDFDLGEQWRSPALDLEIKGDRFKVAIRSASTAVSTDLNTNTEYLDLGPVDHEKWNDWVFHVKWDYNYGTLQIWKNGVLILERLNRPIGYNDKYFPYFKIGIYKWEWKMPNTVSTSTKRVYYADEVRMGSSLATYGDVVPGDMATSALPIVASSLKIIKNTNGSYNVSFIASETVSQASTFILYVSVNGADYIPIVSSTSLKLNKDQAYTILFNTK